MERHWANVFTLTYPAGRCKAGSSAVAARAGCARNLAAVSAPMALATRTAQRGRPPPRRNARADRPTTPRRSAAPWRPGSWQRCSPHHARAARQQRLLGGRADIANAAFPVSSSRRPVPARQPASRCSPGSKNTGTPARRAISKGHQQHLAGHIAHGGAIGEAPARRATPGIGQEHVILDAQVDAVHLVDEEAVGADCTFGSSTPTSEITISPPSAEVALGQIQAWPRPGHQRAQADPTGCAMLLGVPVESTTRRPALPGYRSQLAARDADGATYLNVRSNRLSQA